MASLWCLWTDSPWTEANHPWLQVKNEKRIWGKDLDLGWGRIGLCAEGWVYPLLFMFSLPMFPFPLAPNLIAWLSVLLLLTQLACHHPLFGSFFVPDWKFKLDSNSSLSHPLKLGNTVNGTLNINQVFGTLISNSATIFCTGVFTIDLEIVRESDTLDVKGTRFNKPSGKWIKAVFNWQGKAAAEFHAQKVIADHMCTPNLRSKLLSISSRRMAGS